MLPNEVSRVLRDDPLEPVSVDAALLDVRRRARVSGVRTAGIALAAAAVVAAVVAVPLVLKGSPEAGPAPAPDVVPWSDRTDFEAWEPPSPAIRNPGPQCTASDLTVRRIDQEGATQRAYSTVFLEKRTKGRCTLDGPSVLTGQRDGERVVIPTTSTEPPSDDWESPSGNWLETPATIGRAEVARATYVAVSMCESNQTGSDVNPVANYQDIALRLPDDSLISLGRDLRSNCTPETTRYFFENAPIEQPVRWPSVSASVELPESVQPGKTLEYVVTLTNSGGDEAIDLAPCGGFRQELAFQDMNTNELVKPVVDQRRLNCDGAPSLAPGESRSYEMRLPVPVGAIELAEARLTWQLIDTSPDHSAQGFVAVGNPPPAAAPPTVEDAFVSFAKAPGSGGFGVSDGGIRLGLGRLVVKTMDIKQALSTPNAWNLDPPSGFAGRDGTFSALESIQAVPGELTVTEGAHPHCAGPALDPPEGMASLRQFSVQPAEGSYESCLDWFAVDVFVDGEDRVVAVFLDLWEP